MRTLRVIVGCAVVLVAASVAASVSLVIHHAKVAKAVGRERLRGTLRRVMDRDQDEKVRRILEPDARRRQRAMKDAA